MDRHVGNTLAVLSALRANEAVAWVRHPSLADHPDADLARRLMPRGAGSIVTFGIRGGRDAAARFIESLTLASHLANVGDAKTLVIHPASTTHAAIGRRGAGGGRHRRRPDPLVDRDRGRSRHCGRSRTGSQTLAGRLKEASCWLISADSGCSSQPAAVPTRQRLRLQSFCTAPAWITASGRFRRVGSPTTGIALRRLTCRGTADRRVRRCPRSKH